MKLIPAAIELPDDLVRRLGETPEALGREMRLGLALRLLLQHRISLDEAATISDLGWAEFIATALTEVPFTLEDAVEDALSSPKGPGCPFSADEAESQYRVLGKWKGPDASREGQRSAREFWLGAGVPGARWLVGRLRAESHDDRLNEAASILADLGAPSLGPILEELRGKPAPDPALALLRALGWLGRRARTDRVLAELVLVRYLLGPDPDLREAACTAMRLLPEDRARFWLSARLRDEPDRDVRKTIEEELNPAPNVEGPGEVYLLRVGRRRRWAPERAAARPEDVAEAARDLRLDEGEGEGGLSVFRVEETEDDRRDVAVRFALTCRPGPMHLDYVVFPSELATGLGLEVRRVEDPGLEPFLRGRHHEILGLTAVLTIRLAEVILAHAGRQDGRVREGELTRLGDATCRGDPGLRGFLRGQWASILTPPPGDLATELPT